MKKETITDSIIKANERFLKRSGLTLSEKQTNILYLLERLPIDKLVISFWENKIKTNPLEINGIKYILDFFIEDKIILIGKLKDNTYNLIECKYNDFNKWIDTLYDKTNNISSL